MTIYDKPKLPIGFYVYMYLREDGTPYYIGKGKTDRAWVKHSNETKPPKDTSRIIITHDNLTEMWALAQERWYIRWYGRKDNGTGILRNKTDGGEGATGCIALKGIPKTETHRRHLSESKKGKKFPNISAAKKGVKQTPESNLKRKLTQSGIPKIKVQCPHCGILCGVPIFGRWHGDKCKNAMQ